MSKIDELLKNEKVEWKKLGEVCDIKRGRVISKTYLEQNIGEFPVYSSQTRNKGEIGRINTYDFDGEYATWTTDGAYAGTVFYRNGKFSITNICGLITPKDDKKLLVKFIVYWLQIEAKKHVKGGSGNPKLMSNVVESIKIPIPSLETQEKIVKTLDKFTNYVTELQAELQARNKQYSYYRDMLLSEEYLNKISEKLFLKSNNILKKFKLIEIAELNRGKRVVKSELSENGKYPVFQNSLIPLGYYDYKNFEGGKTCIITAGAAGEIFYQNDDFWAADDVFVITKKDNQILDKYIYYYILNKQDLIKSKVRNASVPRLSRDDIEKVEITLPTIKIQEKIVEILDKFQSLLSDTKGLLPQEIEQRQKQYEFFREKLLTFDGNCAKHTRITLIDKSYFEILKHAANIVGVKLFAIEWKILGDLLDYEQPTKYIVNSTEYRDNYKIPVLTAGQSFILGYTNETEGIYIANKKYPVIIFDDFTSGNHWVDFEFKVKSSAMKILKAKNSINFRYCYHYIQTINIDTTEHKRLWISKFSQIKIPIPTLEAQEYIVENLDKLVKLVNDVKEGLPKEIELRQKQYEYYREKLLTFER